MHKLLSLFILSFFLLFSCSDKKSKDNSDSGIMGESYTSQLGEWSISLWKDLKRGGKDISLNRGENLKDDVRGISFSFDELKVNDLNYYHENFLDIKGTDDAQFVLNLAVHLKRSSMYSNQVSIEDQIKGVFGNDLRSIIVRGKEDYYSDNLCFVYATFQENNQVNLLQFICKEKDLQFYYPAFLNTLSSIRK